MPEDVEILEPNKLRTGPTRNSWRVLCPGFVIFDSDTG